MPEYYRHRFDLPPGYPYRRCTRCRKWDGDIKNWKRRAIVVDDKPYWYCIEKPQKLVQNNATPQSLIDNFLNKLENLQTGGINNYGIVYNDGDGYEITEYVSQFCFYRMRRSGIQNTEYFIDHCLYFRKTGMGGNSLATYRQPTPLQDYELVYLDWLVNRSVFSKVFITKCPKEIFNRGVVYSTDCTPQFLISAAIMVRHLHEYRRMIAAWYEFVKAGVQEELAYVLAHGVEVGMSSKVITGISPRTHGLTNCNHTWISSDYFSKECLENFVNRYPVNEQDKPKVSQSLNYINLASIWGSNHDIDSTYIRLPKAKKFETTNSLGMVTVREGYDMDNLKEVAEEFLKLNKV